MLGADDGLCCTKREAKRYGEEWIKGERVLKFKVDRHPAALDVTQRAALMENPGFGRVFTDHMATARWREGQGWAEAVVGPRRPFEIDPAAAVLHYAQEIFEGLKAYRADSGAVTLFRPEQNARRFNTSARRMAMPEVPEDLFLGAIETLVKVDEAWIPGGEGSLYLRPFMFATEVFLGVRASAEFIFCVIASPVGAYFKGGAKAVTLWTSEDFTRAGPGGTGAAKCGGNYAASLIAQVEAAKNGCDQVIFLDACQKRWVEELGGMNVFFVFDDGSILTPPLGDTILPGITRDSLICLARASGKEVREAPYAIDQWRADAASGRLREAFACGTAAVIAAIGEVKSRGGSWKVGDGTEGPVTKALRDKLVGIQRGRTAGPDGWVHKVL